MRRLSKDGLGLVLSKFLLRHLGCFETRRKLEVSLGNKATIPIEREKSV
jgi:hypothetical protein